jgi:putative endonuclease
VVSGGGEMNNKTLGKIGEDIAVKFLRRNGYGILHRNWRCVLGEIDIVAQEKDFLVFVEIKTRSSVDFGPGYLSVNSRKQQKLIKLGQVYLKRYGIGDKPCRIDVVSIDMDNNTKGINVELIKDAFWER